MTGDESALLLQINAKITDMVGEQAFIRARVEDVHLQTSEIPIIIKDQESLQRKLKATWLGTITALSLAAYSVFF